MENNEKDNNFEYVLDLQKLETGDDNKLIIAGMCSSGDIDHDGERVDMDSLRSQFLKYMENPGNSVFSWKGWAKPGCNWKSNT